MKKRKRAKHYLCEEIVIEILARLPAKSLVRSMAVCRLWKSIITKPQFRLDSKRPSKELLLTHGECYSVVDEGDDNLVVKLEADFPLKHFCFDSATVIGSDNGLLCIGISMEDRYFHRVIVWNPCIRKHVAIPDNPTYDHNTLCAHGFGATASGSDYKYVNIVGLISDDELFPAKAMEIYSLKTGTWRRKYLDYSCYRSTGIYFGSVVVRGRLHWIGRDNSIRNKINSNFIFSFDLEDEVVEHIMLPECLSIKNGGVFPRVAMTKESSLGVIAEEKGQLSTVWVMEEYGDVRSWVKLFDIDLSVGNIPRNLFRLLKNGELLLDLGGYVKLGLGGDHPLKLVTYNRMTGKTRDFAGSSSSSRFCGLVNYYKESLVLLGNDYRAVADHEVLSIWYPLISILSLCAYYGNAPTSAGSVWSWAFLLGVSIICNSRPPTSFVILD